VEKTRTMLDLLRQVERHFRWSDNSTYQPRPSISRVKARKGQVSTRNAGARARPVSPAARKPSRPGTIHHQGSGRTPASKNCSGFSTWSSLYMILVSQRLKK